MAGMDSWDRYFRKHSTPSEKAARVERKGTVLDFAIERVEYVRNLERA